ncbi:MAG: hypothetical protein C5B53_03195 [Candidatus Melainabacteria bacterium]|nr:MAG: hypothetical protein C5B53_03195 [Candidatus Melainabacteria bacterium]
MLHTNPKVRITETTSVQSGFVIFLLALIPFVGMPQSANADYASGGSTTLRTPLVRSASQGERRQIVAPGVPPPAGSGPNPSPLVQGDAVPQPPPTGQAQSPPIGGNWFQQQPERVEEPGNFGRYNTERTRTRDGSGVKMVLPDGAPARAPNANVTNQQLEQYQNQQYPYPGYAADGPIYRRVVPTATGYRVENTQSKYIEDDVPGQGRPRYQPDERWLNLEETRSPLPTVKMFCEMLVILGVVFATVQLGFASYAVVLGHPHSGQRVIGTAAGLILLLMGYSIYKIVMINAFRFNGRTTETASTRPERAQVPLAQASTPITPPQPAGTPRSNLPVLPFYNSRVPR